MNTQPAGAQVLDRGAGMSEEVLRNALLPFYSTKPSGAGLGLTLCREVIEAHGGRISLANRPGGRAGRDLVDSGDHAGYSGVMPMQGTARLGGRGGGRMNKESALANLGLSGSEDTAPWRVYGERLSVVQDQLVKAQTDAERGDCPTKPRSWSNPTSS